MGKICTPNLIPNTFFLCKNFEQKSKVKFYSISFVNKSFRKNGLH